MFKDIFKELREDACLTQDDVANKFNISRTAISKYENGEREPSLELLIKLSDYFNVSIDYLVGKTKISSRFYNAKNLDNLSSSYMSKLNTLISKFIESEALIDFTYDVIQATNKLKK